MGPTPTVAPLVGLLPPGRVPGGGPPMRRDYSHPAMARVLLIADSPWVHSEVAAALGSEDITLDTATDPKAGVEKAHQELYDTCIVDLQVGSMGGMAITRALREASDLNEVPHVRVVMLGDRSADAFLARRAGADAFVVKPIGGYELREAISAPAAL